MSVISGSKTVFCECQYFYIYISGISKAAFVLYI